MHGIFSLDFVFDCINFQNILLSSFEDTTQGIPIFPQRTDQKLETIEFDIQKVQEHLEKLKETKSSGPDQMHPKFSERDCQKIRL
jgi:hypothetical protein